ncbi:MAG: YbjN domain-containing protein [Bacteroidetes bacterium]|nr:MAG: YbjN domain-containing protein [Bacteroidota bacterium]
MLDKLFGRSKKKAEAEPAVYFGRYSDNNKPVEKVNRWSDAENLFKEKKYPESLDAFYEYLRDDAIDNVVHERNESSGRFQFYQGSKIVRGNYDNEHLHAEATLAKMPNPNVPVMRRLLEMNFNLYYSRYALEGEKLCMRFDSDVETASPSKLYYGLKELSTKADKQDDLLVQDFSSLQTTDTEHIIEIPAEEKEIKFQWLQKWIGETISYIKTLDPDKFSGGVAYLLLALAYRIDYLIVPEGKILHDLEKIVELYFKKNERQTTEKNRDMIDAFEKLKNRPQQEVFEALYRSRHTFAIVTPQNYKTIADAIYNASQNINWYRDNNYPSIAAQIAEYGIAYCQYSYSLPRPVTDFFHLFMMVNYGEYFNALGFNANYYNPETKQFDADKIADRVKQIINAWKPKYPNLKMKLENIKYDNMVVFNVSFTTEIEYLNIDTNR